MVIITCLLIVITFHETSVFDRLIGNEIDTLPLAHQTVNPDWLPNDWYLNLDHGYRGLFNQLFGWLVYLFGLQHGAIVGRCILILLFSVAMVRFSRSFRLEPAILIISVWLFLGQQSMGAGEWMMGGLEAKSPSYIFILLALASLVRKRTGWGFFFLGLAISFHVLVGLYATFCATVAWLLTRKLNTLRFKSVLSVIWPFFISGLPGLIVAASYVFSAVPDAADTWTFYVEQRVAHHVIPGQWAGSSWTMILPAFALVSSAILACTRNKDMLFLTWFGLLSSSFYFIGFLIYLSGNTHLLKFYWFRLADTMIPFILFIQLAWLTTYAMKRLSHRSISTRLDLRHLVRIAASGFVLVLFISFSLDLMNRIPGGYYFESNMSSDADMTEWIKENTNTESIFLIPPGVYDFYVSAQRSQVVSHKHSPQSADQIKEWRRRTNDVFNPSNVKKDSVARYFRLTESHIKFLSREYGATHFLTSTTHDLDLDLVYATDSHLLYVIEDQ